jgi:hypothetical protein
MLLHGDDYFTARMRLWDGAFHGIGPHFQARIVQSAVRWNGRLSQARADRNGINDEIPLLHDSESKNHLKGMGIGVEPIVNTQNKSWNVLRID